MRDALTGPSPRRATRGSPDRWARLSDAARSFWIAMEAYHQLVKEDDVRNIASARRHLKRCRRRLARARQWRVRYDQPMPRLVGDGEALSGLRPADTIGRAALPPASEPDDPASC